MKGIQGFVKGHKTNIGRIYSVERNKRISSSRTGMKFSVDHRDNISKANTGTHRSEATKSKISKSLSGEKSYRWKGGITPIHEKIRKSREYRLVRDACYKRDNYTCVWCGVRGGMLNADHIKPFSLFPELRFALDNLRTLCEPCHRTTDTYGGRVNKKSHA